MYFVKTQRIKCLRLFITYKFCMFLAENAQFNLSQTTISIFEFKKMSGFNEQIHKLQNLQITKKTICTHTFFLFDTLSQKNNRWQISISCIVKKIQFAKSMDSKINLKLFSSDFMMFFQWKKYIFNLSFFFQMSVVLTWKFQPY